MSISRTIPLVSGSLASVGFLLQRFAPPFVVQPWEYSAFDLFEKVPIWVLPVVAVGSFLELRYGYILLNRMRKWVK